jgi:PAS domain S-box-containing protein
MSTEVAINESTLLDAILESSDDAIITTTFDGIVTSWNPAAERMFGYTAAEIMDRSIHSLLPSDVAEKEFPFINRVKRGERIAGHETERMRKDGQRFHAAVALAPVRDAGGKLAGILTIVRDITEGKRWDFRRESEKRFRLIADSTPVMIKVTGTNGECEFFNKEWLEFTGRRMDEETGVGWAEGVHPEDLQRCMEIYLTAFSQRRPFQMEFRLRRDDGEYRWMFDSGVPRFDPDGRFAGYIGSCIDITDRKNAEAERAHLLAAEQAARAEVERASRAKDDFLANLSHELRTPLNAILGWARMLRTGQLDAEKSARALDVIERNTLLQVQLVEELLDISRVTTGKLHLNIRSVDLATAVASAVDVVRGSAEAKHVLIETALDPGVPSIDSDPDRLQQVLGNLLTNAVRHTPEGGRIIVTSTGTGDRVVLTVSDTGQGISSDLLPHIFDRFRQGRPGRAARGGLGLGLSIVRQIVELHQGTVHAHSDGEGHGASFTVTLPLRQPTHSITPARPDVTRPVGFPALTGCRVLLVEDDIDSRPVLAEVLRQCGSEVVEAGSVKEALNAFDCGRYDALVCDIGLPDQDGYHLIREVRKLPGGRVLPALAVTAFARIEDRRLALAAGFQMHVSKPVEPHALAAVVAKLMGESVSGAEGGVHAEAQARRLA